MYQSMCSIQVPISNLMQFNQSKKTQTWAENFCRDGEKKKTYILYYFYFLHLVLIGAPLVVWNSDAHPRTVWFTCMHLTDGYTTAHSR